MKIHIDKLDVLFSEYIRKRAVINMGGCEYCGKLFYDKPKENGGVLPAWRQLDCSHFIGRRKRSTRYDPDNAIGTCSHCNRFYLPEHPFEHTEFFRKRLGSARLEQLIIKGNTIVKIDKETVEADLKEKLRLLEGFKEMQ